MLRYDSAREMQIKEDANGFIRASGVVASVGEKLVYFTNGKKTIETITEEGLFGNMDELEGAPLSNDHPKSLITPKDASRHTRGAVITPRRDGNELWIDVKITEEKAISDVKSKRKLGLSAGYTCNLDNDGNQIERHYNHVAIVKVGRSPSSGLRLDGRESFDIDNGDPKMSVIKFPNGKEIKLDCSDAEAQLMQDQIDGLSTRADTAEQSLVTVNEFMVVNFDMEDDTPMNKKLDMMKAKIDEMKEKGENTEKLQAQYDELKLQSEKDKGKMDSNELVSLLDLHEKVQKLNPEIKLRKDDGSIKTDAELYAEAMPDVKLDGQAEGYAPARLDAKIEHLDSENVQRQRGNHDRKDGKKDGLTVQQRADAKFFEGAK